MNAEKQVELRDKVLKPFVDNLLKNLDCDGCTRFIGLILHNKGIEFDIYQCDIREIKDPRNAFPLHYFIKTKENVIFDFKTKKWIGVEFQDTEYCNCVKVNLRDFLFVHNDIQLFGILLKYGMTNDEGRIIANG